MSSQVDDRPKANGHLPADPALRTFRGRSLEEVLPQIRAELGPDAVVVRQREGLMGGIGGFFQQQFVEVQARAGSRRIDLYDEQPAAPAPPPAAPPADAPAAEQGAPLTAAELLRQATGGDGAGRTPAEILRRHSDTFARQLAAAEERAEPVVTAGAASADVETAEPEIPQRRAYATPRPPVVAETTEEPVPLPQRPAPAPDLPPAAAANGSATNGTSGANGANGSAAAAPAARRAAKRRAARGRASAQARGAGAAEPRAARGRARAQARGARAAAKPSAAKRAAAAKAAAAPEPAVADDPAPLDGGVGPQTTQALELAAAIAASVAARGGRDGDAATTAAEPAPAAPAGTGAAPSRPSAPAPATLAPRRSLFNRRRRLGPTTPRRAVGSPEATLVGEQLATRGLAPAATEELLLDATAHVLPFTPGGDVRAAVRTALARRIPTLAPPRIGGRAVAFVGAGGGGKTRCSAGLAAAYAHGSTVPVACLSLAPADGGAELTALLKPHGVRVEVVDGERAAERLAALRREAVVVLDTPAVSPGDPAAVEALAAQLEPLALDEVQLVVPATLSDAVAQELVERLAPLGATGIAMTHADATDHIGAVVELACATRLPLAYVNSGVELPGALAPADPHALAERLLR
ncbi:hypothetical protein [Conexibacter arvalis]|uniref:Flagellar biosynthesis GTPase FlhF n=1 Tax=Conexibacter arvalis TaxID=912552 RepID=A0A840IAN1_9ACTN|nr:hypothetical protein [Conexibacter arvalis]MBB4660980.1 flagellar biosynthesis GTPase FlhF [Conexibacter arvalis]